MSLCIDTQLVAGSLTQKLQAIAHAGFRRFDLLEADFISYDGDADSLRELVQNLGLSLSTLQPFCQLEGFEGLYREQALARFERKLDLARMLGADKLQVCSNDHSESSGDFSQVANDMSRLVQVAEAKGIKIAYLASPQGRCVSDDYAAMKLIEEVDSPFFGLALNSAHSLKEGLKPAHYRRLMGDKIFQVQISDCIANYGDVSLLPGMGDLHLSEWVRVLVKCGYQGQWSLAPQFSAQHSTQSVEDAFRSLSNLLDSASRSDPSINFNIPKMPDRVAALGIEFVEFTADETHAQHLRSLLSKMCFRRERKHRSKQVELWRQGAVNILLNLEPQGFSHQAFLDNGPSVCDMGIRVGNAQQAVERATALGSVPFSQPVTTGELQIPAIKGVGGNVVHFIDEHSDLHRMWDIDFEAVSKTKAVQPAGLRCVDHIAQTMSAEEMQSSLLYYLSVFEMEKSPHVNLVDPGGLIRSQAIQSTENEVRLGLNSAESRRTFAGAFLAEHHNAGVQHIAFRSDDIIESALLLRTAEFPSLSISANYYDDLQAIFSLDDNFVQRLREYNILYDRTADGEFFQIYSVPIFEGFFFEIVQRQGRYAGYGARNAAFRLAAQQKYMQDKLKKDAK